MKIRVFALLSFLSTGIVLLQAAPVTVNVQWQDNISTDGQAVMSLFIDNDNVLANGIIKPMGQTVAAAGAGSFPVNTRGLPPGSYYVHGIMGIDYAGLVRRDPGPRLGRRRCRKRRSDEADRGRQRGHGRW